MRYLGLWNCKKSRLYPPWSSGVGITNSPISRAQGGNISERKELGEQSILRGLELWKTWEHTCHAWQGNRSLETVITGKRGQYWQIFRFLGRARNPNLYVKFVSISSINKTKQKKTEQTKKHTLCGPDQKDEKPNKHKAQSIVAV